METLVLVVSLKQNEKLVPNWGSSISTGSPLFLIPLGSKIEMIL